MTLRLIVLWTCLGVLAAFSLYMVKYKVQALKVEVAAAETQLREEKKNLHVLTAEWTYLNRPERLAQLSAKYLDLKPMQGIQLGDLASIPAAPEETAGAHPATDRHYVTPPRGMTLAAGSFQAR
jgi:cell division protein FtsL